MVDELAVAGRYQVVFTGYPVYGTEPRVVQENFKRQFSLPEKNFKLLFSGKSIVIQKDLSWSEARRYQEQMKSLGALCDILPMEEAGAGGQVVDSFPCPKCNNLQKGDVCGHCGFDVGAYRDQMRAKGFVELRGAGYIKERRQGERRSGKDRRNGVRFEDGRRVGRDRRKYKTGWDDV